MDDEILLSLIGRFIYKKQNDEVNPSKQTQGQLLFVLTNATLLDMDFCLRLSYIIFKISFVSHWKLFSLYV